MNVKIANRFIFILGIEYVMSYLFTEFQFSYNMLSHDTIELQTIYNGFQIESIKRDDSANFESLSEYFSNTSNHIMIQELESCTNYEISAVVTNLQFNAKFVHKENLTTHNNEVPIKLQSIVLDSDAIYIELNFTRTDCVDNLFVVLDNSVRLFYTRYNITKHVIIRELKACKHYHIEILYSLQSNSTVYIIYEQYVKTKPGTLQPAQNLKFDPQSNLFTWEVIFAGNCPPKYIITIMPHNDQKILYNGESTINKYDFGFLAKCLQFQVLIHPEGRVDLSESIHIKTSYKEPGQITNISLDLTNTNMLTITWNRPVENPQCVKHFQIKLNDVLEGTTNEFKYILHAIKYYEISNISVCLITQHLVENCASRPLLSAPQTQTVEIKNVSQINVYSDVNTKRTIITWNEPKGAAEHIKSYDLILVNNSSTLGLRTVALFNMIELPILSSCMSYLLQITTNPVVKRTPTIGSTFEFKTPPQKPFPPEAPQLLSKTANSITMKTLYSTLNDNCGIEMFRFTCVRGSDIRFVDEETGCGLLSNLKSRTPYNCSVTVKNEVGWSESSKIKMYVTDNLNGDFDLFANSISFNSIGISWSRQFVSINLTITKLQNKFLHCKHVDFERMVTLEKSRKYKFSNLEPYTNYSIKAVAFSLLGNLSNDMVVETHPNVPHQVKNLRIINSTRHSVTISWNLPCLLNGRIKGFVIKTQEPLSKSFLPIEGDHIPNILYYTANQNSILPHIIQISVAIKLYNLAGPLNESTIMINTPNLDWLDDWVEISMDDSTHALLNIKSETFMTANDSITGFTLVVSDRVCHNLETDDVLSLLLAKSDCIQQCHFNFIPTKVKVTLNEGKPQVCSKSNELELQRGPDYAILAIVFTTTGHSETFPIVFHSNKILPSSSNFLMFSLVLIVCLVFIIMSVTVGVWYYTNKNPQKDQNKLHRMNSTYIEVQFFPDFYKLIDGSFIANEYKSINDMNLSGLLKSVAQNYPAKNRYSDILPYDYNRVIVTPNEYCTTDYINASYIDGEKQKGQYLATQGPKEETAYDFWHMVIEQNCDKIVMLTQLTENTVTKCFKYYPNVDETLVFNDITITNGAETNMGTFLRRELNVGKMDRIKHLIIQYQFLVWPDLKCPENELDVIEFIEFINNEKSINPMVVHCSAGIGRTGTFIALDILLQSFRHDKFINIFDTVRNLRVQRYGMVQNVAQYEFLYALVNVYFHRRMYK